MSSTTLRIALAQLNLFVGDVAGNTQRVIDTAAEARALGADLVMFPELTLCGYPPEDLLFHNGLRRQVAAALERVRTETRGIAVMVGYPEYQAEDIYNSAALIRDGEVLANYRKQELPNYSVFDEKRYFQPGQASCIVEIKGIRIALLICEDIWRPGPARAARALGAQLLCVINGSPYSLHYQQRREEVARARARETGLPVVYLNLLGGQDELVFDGASFVMDGTGQVAQRFKAFEEGLFMVNIDLTGERALPQAAALAPLPSEEASVYDALVLGVRDYVGKHGFPGVVIGLSGGVDSALTLALAVDALGAERVRAVMMPSRYTSQMSLEDAQGQADLLGVRYDVIPIETLFATVLEALEGVFAGRPPDTTEENVQARCRGLLLMAISNKTRRMLLTTGNKSEISVGYSTLYGDMAGGFAPIKDCSKLLVYRLAKYRNTIAAAIPVRVIEREPSAELRANQKDSDSLPPYEILDPILELFIEDDLSVDEIAAKGFDRATVGRVLDMVKRNEYKRRQAPPGIRISDRAFGRDWRYPITSGYSPRAIVPGGPAR
nr:NAD+ synthase [Steroidobacter denitrificans]